MNAYNLILDGVKDLINHNDFTQVGKCKTCQRSNEKLLEKDKICAVCFFLKKPNNQYFGMLTGVRAHSPISFINSLLVFDEIDGITLVVSPKYAEKIPPTKQVKVVIGDVDRFTIELLKRPKKMVVIKPSIRLEEYANNLILSDEKSVFITDLKGGYWVNIDKWNKLINLNKTHCNNAILDTINFIFDVSIGKISNTDLAVREFISQNRALVVKMNDLLDMDVHSKIFILKLLKMVCNDRAK